MTTLKEKLEGYYCTEQYHRFNLFTPIVATDGAIAFAQEGGAFWVLDEIVLNRMKLIEKRVINKDTWLFVKIKSTGKKADIFFEDGNNNVFKKKHIAYTDLEKGDYDLWYMNGVILLPSEY